jgi:ABC-2 type transport system permease protein
MMDAIVAEYRKLRTTRTAGGLFLGLALLTGLGIYGTLQDASPAALAGGLGATFGSAGAVIIAIVFVVVLAIRSFTDEWRHGSIVPTFLTTPDRRRVLAAKTTVAVGAAVVFALGCIAVATGVRAVYLTSHGFALSSWVGRVAGLTVRALAITALWAVIGVAIGAIVRHQVAAIVGTLAWLFVVENIIASSLPAIARWLPANASGTAAGIHTPGITPLEGLATLAAWATVAVVCAVPTLARRDVA